MRIDLLDVAAYNETHLMATLDVTHEDGTVVRTAHFMPKDVMEWRVAEYDLDPDDDQLLDLVLWEQYVTVPPGKGLHEAGTVAEAREALLEALAERTGPSNAAKARARGLARGTAADPEVAVRKRMREMSLMDPEVVEQKRRIVTLQRDRSKEAARPSPSQPADRAAQFRAQAEEMTDAADPDAQAGAR